LEKETEKIGKVVYKVFTFSNLSLRNNPDDDGEGEGGGSGE
jgi:hypothetical protein